MQIHFVILLNWSFVNPFCIIQLCNFLWYSFTFCCTLVFYLSLTKQKSDVCNFFERERVRVSVCMCVCVIHCVCVCACVCVRERERDRINKFLQFSWTNRYHLLKPTCIFISDICTFSKGIQGIFGKGNYIKLIELACVYIQHKLPKLNKINYLLNTKTMWWDGVLNVQSIVNGIESSKPVKVQSKRV